MDWPARRAPPEGHPGSVRRFGAAGTSWCSRSSASLQELPRVQGRPVHAGRTDPAVRGRGPINLRRLRRPGGLIRFVRQSFPGSLRERSCPATHQRLLRGSGAEDGASRDGGRSSTATGGACRDRADLRGLSRRRRRRPARSPLQRHGPREVRYRSHTAGRHSGHKSRRTLDGHRRRRHAPTRRLWWHPPHHCRRRRATVAALRS